MKLNVYKNQREIAKTLEVDNYDLMYGTVEDIFDVMEGIDDLNNTTEMVKMFGAFKPKIDDLLLDIFEEEGLTKEDLKHVKVKELVPVFIELFQYVQQSFRSKN